MAERLLIVIGGTFDPVHYAHLRLAAELNQTFPKAEICFMPTAKPAHRQSPRATAADRFNMIKLALEQAPEMILSDLELKRSGNSYTIDTLKALKKIAPQQPVAWVLGNDAFQGITTWKNVDELSQYCHFIVANRPGFIVNEDDFNQFGFKLTTETTKLTDKLSGFIYQAKIPLLDISATKIRKLINDNHCRDELIRWLVPEKVQDFIFKKQLYKSTE